MEYAHGHGVLYRDVKPRIFWRFRTTRPTRAWSSTYNTIKNHPRAAAETARL